MPKGQVAKDCYLGIRWTYSEITINKCNHWFQEGASVPIGDECTADLLLTVLFAGYLYDGSYLGS